MDSESAELSREFGLNDFEAIINSGKLKIGNRDETHIWFEVDDIDGDDNLIYNGVEITSEGSRKRMEISQYLD